ncbi:MAG: GNAT family N-acetyltransferase [Lachnospiraceae bacterium]|nr:GNAT family N-acetyltransferase [Lachnospiraceae bacterium]
MEIRQTTETDFPDVMKIYTHARYFMAEHGNPNQWGPTNWPPEALIHSDIRAGNSYVCICEDKIAGTFFFAQGKDIEPTYRVIRDGDWLDGGPYGVIHRLAGNGAVHGVGEFCIEWAFRQCGHLRIDTHRDNRVMRNLLKKCGFVYCGIISVEEDSSPRLAYEKTDIKRKSMEVCTEAGLVKGSGIL